MEKKETFFKTCFKPDAQLKNYPYTVDAKEFNEETQCITTLLSQFLGMDTDKYITYSMMSLLFTPSTFPVDSEDPSQSVQVSCLKFDEFLDENFHSQLVDFPKTRTFIFQSYLLRMFLSFNQENLQISKMAIREEINNVYTKFMKFFYDKSICYLLSETSA